MVNTVSELKTYIHANCAGMMREAAGQLVNPYTVPCSPDSPYYSYSLWDWDSWLISIVLGQVEADTGDKGRYIPNEIGCIQNFCALQTPDGRIPICVDPQSQLEKNILHGKEAAQTNMHKPVLAQHAAALVARTRDTKWLSPLIPGLEKFINLYLADFVHPETGLAFWKDDFAVGADNDPSVFFRPDRSCGSVYLNCLLYRELLAMGYLLEELGDVRKANLWRGKAQDLRDAVNRYCWDERDGTYYSVDFALRPVDPKCWLHSGAPRRWPCLLLRIDSWCSFMPLWAGIASKSQAERMMARCRDEKAFCCNFGIRSLSRLEKMYDTRATNNPSNWLGPVWGIINFMLFSGFLRYGYETDARVLADKTIALFGRDLARSGCLHEYYEPDTGEPVMTHGFMNWNFLVLNMIAWLEGRPFCDTF